MELTQALSDAEIDELDDFLLSDDTPDSCMNLPTMDGFFAALILNPRLIMPGEFLNWIWDMDDGEEEPSFASIGQIDHIMGLVMRYYDSVLDAIGNDDFEPLFYVLEQKDGSEFFDAEGWAEGFMLGVNLFSETWGEIFEKHMEWLVPVMLLGTDDGWEMLARESDVKRITRDAYEAFADVVKLLYDHFSAQRTAQMQESMVQPGRHPSGMRIEAVKMPAASLKVGRNEKCQCGSGLKFKKCCGVPPTLH